MMFDIKAVKLRPSTSTSAVRAYADVLLSSDVGTFEIFGFAIIESDGKTPWVAPPQKPGKNGKKYFPLVELGGKLKELVANAILDAYESSKN